MPIPVNEGLIKSQQGKGSAFILPAHDFSGLARMNDHKERSAARNQAKADKKAATRKKEVNDILNKNYDLGAQRDTGAIGTETQALRDYVTGELSKGNRNVTKAGTPEWQKYKEMEDNIINSAKNSVEENKWLNNSINQIRQSNDPYLDKEKAVNTILDHYYGNDGDKNIFSEDYGSRPNWIDGAFNEGKYLEDFVNNLPEQISQTFSKQQTGLGTYINTEEVKGKLFQVNDDGTVTTTKDGKPIIKASDETVTIALQNPRFKRYIEDQMTLPENANKDTATLIKEKLQARGFANVKKDVKKGFTTKQPRASGRTDKDQIFARQEVIERTQKNIDKQFNSLKGGKLPDGKTTIQSVKYDESNPKLWFNEGAHSIDISAENNGGFEELWNVYNTVPGFKKIDVTELKENAGYNEQYPAFNDQIDYGEKSPLKKDIEKLIDAPKSLLKKRYINGVLKNNDKVKKVNWDDGALEVEYHDGSKDHVVVPKRDKQKELDTQSYKNLQDLLIKNNKAAYQKKIAPNTIDFDGLNF